MSQGRVKLNLGLCVLKMIRSNVKRSATPAETSLYGLSSRTKNRNFENKKGVPLTHRPKEVPDFFS